MSTTPDTANRLAPGDSVRAYKNDPAGLRLPIRTPGREVVGGLRLIDRTLAADQAVAEALAGWRDRAREHFLTRFPVSARTTSDWLQSLVAAEGRLLFLIEDETGRRVGHLGARNIRESTGELDNLLRGEPGGHPKLILFAEANLLDWLGSALHLRTVHLAVLSHNYHAIALHESIGFRRSRVERVWYEGSAEAGQYLSAAAPTDEPPALDVVELVRMDLQLDEFRRWHPWLTDA